MKLILILIFSLEVFAADYTPHKTYQFKNGLTLYYYHDAFLPVTEMELYLKAGEAVVAPEKQGLSYLMMSLLENGTKNRTATQISNELDKLGATFSAISTKDYMRVSAASLTKHVSTLSSIFSDCILNPTFPLDEIIKKKKQTIAEIISSKDSPKQLVALHYYAFMYGAHPYARPVYGSEKSLNVISKSDLEAFYKETVIPSNAVMVIVSSLKFDEIFNTVLKSFETWKDNSPKKNQIIPAPVFKKGFQVLLVDQPQSTQAQIRFGKEGIASSNADRIAIHVTNSILGDGFTSRLNNQIRDNLGLTYGIGAGFETGKVGGLYTISTFTKTSTVGKIIREALGLYKEYAKEGPREDEIASAKAYVKGQFMMGLDTASAIAQTFTVSTLMGQAPNYLNTYVHAVEKLQSDDIKKILVNYFGSENFGFVIVGNSKEIKPQLKFLTPNIKVKNYLDELSYTE